eukprot:TRINITY_DN18064_c0_g1_i3.p1 TRINITY_DN18064_c0_g1~~TRINITY_DN18064_c0_g1_i3.p1  ORF type:complete len:204 (-),score=22.80 TRINITY_DN18064_c0_g1_i3:301-912(-)
MVRVTIVLWDGSLLKLNIQDLALNMLRRASSDPQAVIETAVCESRFESWSLRQMSPRKLHFRTPWRVEGPRVNVMYHVVFHYRYSDIDQWTKHYVNKCDIHARGVISALTPIDFNVAPPTLQQTVPDIFHFRGVDVETYESEDGCVAFAMTDSVLSDQAHCRKKYDIVVRMYVREDPMSSFTHLGLDGYDTRNFVQQQWDAYF